jgi:hypothetical protein
MDEVLTRAEIEARFPSERVLVGNPGTDESLEVLKGTLFLHSRDRDEFDRKALAFHGGRFAVLYTGRTPEGMEYVL